jgi:hypothetical protein
MATDNWTDSSDSWSTASDWSAGVPTSTSSVVVGQGDPQVTAPISIASLTVSADVSFADAGASSVSGAVTNSGQIHVDDNGGVGGPGGTALTIGGTLTNSGYFGVGAGNLGAAATVSVGAIANFINTTLGTITIGGNSTASVPAKLVDAAAAGTGASGQIVGSVNLSGASVLQFASGQITTIANQSELTLYGPNAFVADAGAATSNSALVGLTTINGTLHLWDIKPLTLSGGLTNTYYLDVDNNGGVGGPGGSTLSVTGTLTNSGTIGIGTTNLLANTTVNAAALTNYVNSTLGAINVNGNTTTSNGGPFQASLNVASAAGFGVAGSVVGSVNLTGDALLQFASGQITKIAASSELTLYGQEARLADASSPSTLSALTGLNTITGALHLWDAQALTLTGGLSNTGTLDVDYNGGIGGPGGSALHITGALTNSGTVGIGTTNLGASTIVTAASITNSVSSTFGTINVSGNEASSVPVPVSATFNIASAAGFGTAGVLTGSVNLTGDQNGHALLEFASGEITTIAAGSELTLSGPDAFLADASDTSSNSALTGLKTITGALHLWDAAPTTLSGGLTNTGTLDVDYNGGIGGPGGSHLTVTGTLTNSGTVGVGTTNLGASTFVTAAALVNSIGSSYGAINISGNTNTSVPVPVSSTVTINSAAGFGTAGTLTGSVNLTGSTSGYAILAFASGEITTIAANSELTLSGQGAFLADTSDESSNSALTGLKTITGTLNLWDVAPTTFSGNVTNTGALDVDYNGGIGGPGGSTLTISGTLTSSGAFNVGTTNLSAPTSVTLGGLVNSIGSSYGAVNIAGDFNPNLPAPESTTVAVNSAAGFGTAGVLTGSVNLTGNVMGSATLAFASGQITTIAANSELTLWGPDAFVADASDTSSSSALVGLKTISGALHLWDSAPLTLSGALTVSGTLDVDNNGGIGGPGGSNLTVSGTLTNSGSIAIGTTNLSANSTLTAASLNNSGTINVSGSSTLFGGALDVTGAVVNTGAINIYQYANVAFGGALSGSGTVYLNNGVTLSVGGGGGGGVIAYQSGAETVDVTGSTLGDAVQGFAADDTIDFETVAYSSSDYVTFSRSGAGGTGTIDSASGAAVASFGVSGAYNASYFSLSDDASGHLVVNYAAGHPLATADDFNGDSYSDILFGKVDNTFSLLEQQGATTVGGGSIGGPGAAWSYVATGNFNDDAYADILYVNASGALADWLMNGTSLIGGGTIGNPGGTWSVVGVGDFYGQGDSDILYRNAAGAYSIWAVSGTAVVGGGSIGNPGAGWTFEGIGDFNGDGKSDILFENTAGTYAIWNMNGASIASGATLGSPGAGWVYKGVGDFNGDGTSDILFENANTGMYAIWDIEDDKLIGGGNVGAPGSAWTLDAIGDDNGDGKSDLLFQNVVTGAYAIWDLSNTSIIASASLSSPGAAYSVVQAPPAAKPELPATILFQDTSGNLASWTTNGASITGGANFGNPGAGWSAVGVGDFNGDGQVDILLKNASGQLAIWDTNGVAVTGGGTIGSPGGTWQVKAIGDFNGDGVSDLLFEDASGNYATWDINGASIIGGGAIGNPGAGWTFAAAADFTGDGQSDLLFENASGLYAIWDVSKNTMVGGGNVGAPGSSYTLMGTGDFNGDGKADLLFESNTGVYSIWELSGASIVGGGAIGNPGSGFAFAGIADLNGDHHADILFKSTSGNTYAVWDINGTSIVGGGTLGAAGGSFHMVGVA